MVKVLSNEEIEMQRKDLHNALNSKIFKEIIIRYNILLKIDPSIMPLLFFFEIVKQEGIILDSYKGLDTMYLQNLNKETYEFLKENYPKQFGTEFRNLFEDETSITKEIEDILSSINLETVDNKFACIFSMLAPDESKVDDIIMNKIEEKIDSFEKQIKELPYVKKTLEYLNNMKENYLTKSQLLEQFVNEEFTIFPTNLDKTPSCNKWNKLDNKTSKWIYSESSNYKTNHGQNPKNLGIGLVCGQRSGVVVIDIDLKDNGMKHWFGLFEKRGIKDIDTLKVETGSGGLHYYFNYCPSMEHFYSMNRLFETGIDFRSDNGYVIVPPSIHPNGNKYKFLVDVSSGIRNQIKEMPNWLFKELDKWYLQRKKEVVVCPFKSMYKTKDNCLRYVIENPCNLYYVPDRLKTSEMLNIVKETFFH